MSDVSSRVSTGGTAADSAESNCDSVDLTAAADLLHSKSNSNANDDAAASASLSAVASEEHADERTTSKGFVGHGRTSNIEAEAFRRSRPGKTSKKCQGYAVFVHHLTVSGQLPSGLDCAQRYEAAGEAWKALSEEERSAFRWQGKTPEAKPKKSNWEVPSKFKGRPPFQLPIENTSTYWPESLAHFVQMRGRMRKAAHEQFEWAALNRNNKHKDGGRSLLSTVVKRSFYLLHVCTAADRPDEPSPQPDWTVLKFVRDKKRRTARPCRPTEMALIKFSLRDGVRSIKHHVFVADDAEAYATFVGRCEAALQGQHKPRFLLVCASRWDSTFDSLDYAIRQAASSNTKPSPLSLRDNPFTCLEDFVLLMLHYILDHKPGDTASISSIIDDLGLTWPSTDTDSDPLQKEPALFNSVPLLQAVHYGLSERRVHEVLKPQEEQLIRNNWGCPQHIQQSPCALAQAKSYLCVVFSLLHTAASLSDTCLTSKRRLCVCDAAALIASAGAAKLNQCDSKHVVSQGEKTLQQRFIVNTFYLFDSINYTPEPAAMVPPVAVVPRLPCVPEEPSEGSFWDDDDEQQAAVQPTEPEPAESEQPPDDYSHALSHLADGVTLHELHAIALVARWLEQGVPDDGGDVYMPQDAEVPLELKQPARNGTACKEGKKKRIAPSSLSTTAAAATRRAAKEAEEDYSRDSYFPDPINQWQQPVVPVGNSMAPHQPRPALPTGIVRPLQYKHSLRQQRPLQPVPVPSVARLSGPSFCQSAAPGAPSHGSQPPAGFPYINNQQQLLEPPPGLPLPAYPQSLLQQPAVPEPLASNLWSPSREIQPGPVAYTGSMSYSNQSQQHLLAPPPPRLPAPLQPSQPVMPEARGPGGMRVGRGRGQPLQWMPPPPNPSSQQQPPLQESTVADVFNEMVGRAMAACSRLAQLGGAAPANSQQHRLEQAVHQLELATQCFHND